MNPPIENSNLKIQQIPPKGRGVFSKISLTTDQIIEVCPVISLSPEDSFKISSSQLSHYCFRWKNPDCFALALGWGSLYNHSPNPNAYFLKNYDQDLLILHARRNIAAEEEITINYNQEIGSKPIWFEVK